MPTNTFVEIDFPEAVDLADLTGIQIDLQSAREFAVQLKSLREAQRYDSGLLVEALSVAALVRYSRPFVTGVRQRLGEEALGKLTAEQLAKHEHLRLFRDKHIAHSVNAFEDNQPVARYWVERVQEEGITAVECNHTRISGLGMQDIDAVIELSTTMLAFVDQRRSIEKSRVLEVVRGKPIAEILSRRGAPPRIPASGEVGRSRRRP